MPRRQQLNQVPGVFIRLPIVQGDVIALVGKTFPQQRRARFGANHRFMRRHMVRVSMGDHCKRPCRMRIQPEVGLRQIQSGNRNEGGIGQASGGNQLVRDSGGKATFRHCQLYRTTQPAIQFPFHSPWFRSLRHSFSHRHWKCCLWRWVVKPCLHFLLYLHSLSLGFSDG